MSAEGRQHLSDLFRSAVHQNWATHAPTDAAKVQAEYKGQRRPACSSLYGKALVGLCRLNPPPNPTPPPTLNPLWKHNLVVTVSLSSFSGIERAAARQKQYGTIAVLLDNDPLATANQTELPTIQPGLRAAGWKIVGWAPTYAANDATQADQLIRAHDLDGWIPNLESWAEGPNKHLTKDWLTIFRNLQPTIPLLVSCLSSDTGNYARDFDYQACLNAGAGISPQVYGSNFPTYTVGAMKANLAKAGVPLTVVAPWFSIDKGTVPSQDYETWNGPHGIWTGDSMHIGQWPL